MLGSKEIRIALDEKQFRTLCRGEIVQVQDRFTDDRLVKIALRDIGWDRMYRAIEDAEEGKSK